MEKKLLVEGMMCAHCKAAVEKVKNFDPNDFNLDVPATIPKVLAVQSNVIDRDEFLKEAIGDSPSALYSTISTLLSSSQFLLETACL